jgi:hypothetical protein
VCRFGHGSRVCPVRGVVRNRDKPAYRDVTAVNFAISRLIAVHNVILTKRSSVGSHRARPRLLTATVRTTEQS